MLYIESDGIVRLTRGDTARLTVDITNITSEQPYIIGDKDVLTLSLKKNINDTEPTLQKVITGSSIFHIEPDDTKNLSFGKYKYDVQLTTESGDVYTVIEPSVFELMQEVTY